MPRLIKYSLIASLVLIGLGFTVKAGEVHAQTPTPPVGYTPYCPSTVTPTSIIPTADMSTLAPIGTPETCYDGSGTPYPCPTGTATQTPTATYTPTVTPTPTGTLGAPVITCGTGSDLDCYQVDELTIRFTGDFVQNDNWVFSYFNLSVPSHVYARLSVYGEAASGPNGNDPTGNGVRAWDGPFNGDDGEMRFHLYAQNGAFGVDMFSMPFTNIAYEWGADHKVNPGNYDVDGEMLAGTNHYVAIEKFDWFQLWKWIGFSTPSEIYVSSVPIIGTPTPITSVTPTATVDPCASGDEVVDTWTSGILIKPGQCYTIIPGGTWDFPASVVDFLGLGVDSMTVPGFRICLDYLVYESELFGITFTSIIGTAAFVFALTMLYREFRS